MQTVVTGEKKINMDNVIHLTFKSLDSMKASTLPVEKKKHHSNDLDSGNYFTSKPLDSDKLLGLYNVSDLLSKLDRNHWTVTSC